MAEAIAKKLVGTKAEIRSAGTEAWSGMSASVAAQDALLMRGIDLMDHHSQELSEELVAWADVIFTVTRQRERQITDMFPHAGPKLRLLDPNAPIEDPIGAGVRHYAQLARKIEVALKPRLTELGLL